MQSHLIHEFIKGQSKYAILKFKFIFYQDQLGSADVSQNDPSDVVGIGTLRTIDQKKEELHARNREYQRRYGERKRNEAAGENMREQNLNQKLQMQVGEKKQWPGLVTIFPEPSASIRINGDEANLLNTNEKIRAAMDSLKVSQNMISLNPNSVL